jgi:glycosyltransferase involved in cell wall biosynthesis
MRLLFLNHNYRYSGTYYRAMPMAEQLAGRGHQVTLFTVSREHKWQPTWAVVNGVRLCEAPGLAQGYSGEGYGPLDNAYRVLHALAHRCDIVHMFDHKPNATFAGFAGRLRGAKLVADWADWWGGPGGVNDVPKRRVPAVGQFETWWEVQSKLWADGVVTISTVLRQRALDIGVPAERILYLPTGAALDRIRLIPIAVARKQLGIPLERRMAGFIGIGQGELEWIMLAQQKLADVWLMVIGPKNPRVADLARSLGVADRLWQTDLIPDSQVALYLACADVFCMPMGDHAANRGRLPNKVLDYMAAGRPIVANPVGDVKTILEKHRVGLLTSQDGFAETLGRLLADPALCTELGQNARRTAETVFAWPHLIDQLEALYTDLLGTGRRGRG